MKFVNFKSSSFMCLFLFLYSVCVFPVSLYFIFYNKSLLVEWEIISVSSSSMTFPIIFDPVSLSCSNLVCLISACVLLFSSSYMDDEVFLSRFIWLLMLFVLSMNLLVFIPSLLSLLLGWDGLGIVSFALVIYYENKKSLAAGMITVLANRIGDVLLILAIVVSVNQGMWSAMFNYGHPYSFLIAMSIMIAAMTKSAQIPFSSWLPAAMAAPTPVSALVHSSTLVTAGVFLLIRFYSFLSEFEMFFSCCLLFSVLTMLMAGIGANFEFDLKKIIALSTLSQLGVMMLSLALGMPMLALFHLYTHAMFKALLFLCAGAIIHKSSHNQDIRCMGNIWQQMPLSIACLNTANLALCGAPFLAGFYSKDLILECMLVSNTSLLMLLFTFFATGLTASYSVRLSLFVLWKQSNHLSYSSMNDEDWVMTFPMIVLTINAIIGGFFLQKLIPGFNNFFYMTEMMKMMVVFVTLIGVFMAFLLWNFSSFYNYGSSINKHFMSSMWFLTPLSSQPLTFLTMSISGMYVKFVDQGWLELYGGKGMMVKMSYLTKVNQYYQNNYISTFILLIVLSFIVIMGICFLF